MNNKYRSAEDYYFINGTMDVERLHPNAEMPSKEHQYDATWELTIISRDENRVEDEFQDVNVFNTGISVTGPKGYHFEIVEHPQLYKTGYSLVGGPRIINPEDDTEIKIPLFKFKEVEDIELPFRAALLVMRQTEYILVNPTKNTGESEKVPVQSKYEETQPRKGRGTKGKRKGNMF